MDQARSGQSDPSPAELNWWSTPFWCADGAVARTSSGHLTRTARPPLRGKVGQGPAASPSQIFAVRSKPPLEGEEGRCEGVPRANISPPRLTRTSQTGEISPLVVAQRNINKHRAPKDQTINLSNHHGWYCSSIVLLLPRTGEPRPYQKHFVTYKHI